MGLDMYLTKKIYVGANYEHREVKGTIYLTTHGKEIPIDFNKVSYIEEECMYWRKANAIHKWFVDNVQGGEDNCGSYYVSKAQLKELLSTCKKVLRNKKLAPELLPTQSGFFFGGTDYDEYYFEDLKNTVDVLSKEDLSYEDGYDIEYRYSSSW